MFHEQKQPCRCFVASRIDRNRHNRCHSNCQLNFISTSRISPPPSTVPREPAPVGEHFFFIASVWSGRLIWSRFSTRNFNRFSEPIEIVSMLWRGWNKNMFSNLGSKRWSTVCLAFCTACKGDHAPLNGNYDNHPVEPGLLQQITSSYQSSDRMEDILDSIIFIANDGFHASHLFCPLPYIRGAAVVRPISFGWSTPIKRRSAHELSALSLNFVFWLVRLKTLGGKCQKAVGGCCFCRLFLLYIRVSCRSIDDDICDLCRGFQIKWPPTPFIET